MGKNFKEELTQLINKYGYDSDANTPDFLLAEYVVDVLSAHIAMTRTRDEWKERQQAPETPNIPEEVKRVADAVAKALGGNCTIKFVKVDPPQRKRKNHKKKNHGKASNV